MKFLDICSGIGGFRLGFERAGHECVGFIEIDKYARKSYGAMYDTKNEWTAYDVTKVSSEEIPYADCWCFGFPDELFEKASKVNCNSQLYKQAGNSVTVNVTNVIAEKIGENV